MSGIYRTAAWGNTKQPDFLNQVIIVQTTLTAAQTMQAILPSKKKWQDKNQKNAPRIIDIDILFFKTKKLSAPKTLKYRTRNCRTAILF